MLKELQESLEIAIKRIDENTNLFYQNKKDVAYKELDETLRIIENSIDVILKYDGNIGIREDIESKIVKILYDAMKALEVRDELLLSDILQYELKEILTKIKDSIS